MNKKLALLNSILGAAQICGNKKLENATVKAMAVIIAPTKNNRNDLLGRCRPLAA